MKLYKLYTHTKSYNDADLLINNKEHPDAKAGDIVEVFHRDDEENTRLLLQITTFTDLKNRDVISIESGVANQFKLRTFNDVVMRVVDVADVALDSIEITFKDQYMGRSEMWRLKKYLTNTCVYVNKKIDYNDMQIRCQVYEMWSQGERVSCGVITEDTKIVFRSSTSMVYLFLQMSSEMWDFDIHGDLYFEKAVNGFLTELFHKWKKLGCNHEVTIVLFSRTFYAAKSLDEFPDHMRECLQMDYKGRFYEDFYRVAIQNERNDDWCTVLAQLRKLFTSYQKTVLNYHARDGVKIPTAYNSTAAQGNFLEVLNISLNTFEKHYLDRTFDRTGQLSVVVTPGVGVFEVDRELTNITKQRIIDNGVGSDLVCVGEQPLHAVPLLKFHNKDTSLTAADDYSLPHWINLSFYSTNKKIAYSNFIPRIKLPPMIANAPIKMDTNSDNENNFLSCNQSEYIHNSLFDYEAYDDQIFQPPPAQGTCSLQRIIRAKKTSVPSLETYAFQNNDWEIFTPTKVPSLRRKMSDPDIHHGTSGILAAMSDVTNLSESLASEKNARRSIVSIAPIVRPGRSLINPFDPSHVTIKLTSNRRRWTHIFPKGPTGVLIQQHHYQAVPAKQNCNQFNNNNDNDYSSCYNSMEYDHTSNCSTLSKSITNSLNHTGETDKLEITRKRNNSLLNTSALVANTSTAAVPAKSFLWGATGEQEWTPAITTVWHVTTRFSDKHHIIFNSPQQSYIARSTVLKTERAGGRIIHPAADAAAIALNSELNQHDDYDEGSSTEIKLRPNASINEIFEAMKHPVNGVAFISQTQSLPSYTFVSFDALMWLKNNLDNSRNPLEILEAMRKEKLICHASGDFNKPVIAGFYLYFIAQQDKNVKDYIRPLNDLSAFENEWMEIELLGSNSLWNDEANLPHIPNFLKDIPPPQSWTDCCKNQKIYRHSHLEIDVNQKSERMEWGHVKYHTVMQTGFAFEIVVQWVTSSGPIVWDLINGWIRKANQCNYQLVPVPADPMAEPFTEKSDPLRGPIFIPLATQHLNNGVNLFEEFAEETRADRMLLFQEAILARFGFLPCVVEKKFTFNKDIPKEYQYVHCSGNMFALIRCSKNTNYQMDSPSRQEANVTRCVYGHTNNTNVPKKIGFLWAWNHMIPNKKWKSLLINNSSDGELFQLKMLKDFREFCSNIDNRLVKFWNHCHDLKRASLNNIENINNNNNNIDNKTLLVLS
ncbi:GATOR complex protein Iml1 [Lucilia cuprina]|uniref:GATOR complex protein Iml1 n=1 Tax=Lucilia cuprina TaxID=7375 RepID=UPI001F052C45|nr:GATOR complex protein Iml1 [Lucilia cuprina]